MGTDQPRDARPPAVVVVVRAWVHDDRIAARLVLDTSPGPADRLRPRRRPRSVVVGSLDELCAVLTAELTAGLRPRGVGPGDAS